MEALIIEHAGFAATLIGCLFAAVLALLGFLFRDLWARVAKAPKEYVTKAELEQALDATLGSLTKDMEQLSEAIEQATTRLRQGDGCFNDLERAFRIILFCLHRLCRAWEARFKEKMDCQELAKLAGNLHAG
ncbi:MAG: hypothetical protein K9K65_11755 [Desulfarculaceae bacterium]|nr:hypothetical protein [Desulfarculaceae bacterium]MCF8122317.1 hypothetical protein [Desulfarculaceae bacterium]